MQNGNWSRLVVEALIVFCIGMGSILLWDSGATFFRSGLSWKQQWRLVMEQAVNETTPSQQCGNQPFIVRPQVRGLCGILNGQPGCCTGTPPITPEITIGSCSSRCLNLYASYWCTVSCQGNFNVENGTASLCTSSVQNLLDECQTCSPALLPYVTPQEFSQNVFIRVSSAIGCFPFDIRALPAEIGPPVLTNVSVATRGGCFSANPALFPFVATLRAEIRNGNQVPYGGEVSCISPAGKPGNPKKLTSNDFTRLGNGNWEVTASCNFGPKVPRSLWNFFLRIDNTNGSVISDSVPATQFEICNDYVPPGGNFGIVLLCEPRNAAEVLNALGVAAFGLSNNQRADRVECCDPDSKCTISGVGVGILISNVVALLRTLDLSSLVATIVNLLLPALSDGLLLSGGTSITITGVFTCESKLFGTDASIMAFANGGSMIARRGCLFDLSTIEVNFTSSSAGALLDGMPGDNFEEATFELQQATAPTGGLEVRVAFRLDVDARMAINGKPNAIIAIFIQGILLDNLGATGIPQFQVLIAGGIVFGSSQVGLLLQFTPLEIEPPPATRATTQPNGASLVICEGPGNAVAGLARITATSNTGVFIRPPNVGDDDCAINRRFKLVDNPSNPAPFNFDPPSDNSGTQAGWLINSYFGYEFTGGPTSWADYPTPAQRTTVRLELQNNARLVIVNARQNGAFSVVYGAVKFDQGSIIEVELAQANVASNAFEVVLIRYQTSERCNNPLTAASCSSEQCDVDATLVVSNPIANRPATMICRNYRNAAEPNVPTGWKELVLQFPAAPVVTPPSAAILPFLSRIQAIIIMDRSIVDYPVERFLAALNNILGITPAEIQIDSYQATESSRRQTGDRIRAAFHCRSSVSIEDADAKCSRILQEANTPGSALANELRTVSTGQVNDRDVDDTGSDEALYGLFALAAIPIICIVIICLFLKNRKRKADNQYMQDTATFSNVAAQPQPINYPYPYYDPAVPAQALAYDGKAPSALALPPPAYPAYGY